VSNTTSSTTMISNSYS